jgi:hypothetical protein
VPVRLVKHGAYFDFMIAWRRAEPTDPEWRTFTKLLGDEITASRTLLELLSTGRARGRKKYHALHRPIVLK